MLNEELKRILLFSKAMFRKIVNLLPGGSEFLEPHVWESPFSTQQGFWWINEKELFFDGLTFPLSRIGAVDMGIENPNSGVVTWGIGLAVLTAIMTGGLATIAGIFGIGIWGGRMNEKHIFIKIFSKDGGILYERCFESYGNDDAAALAEFVVRLKERI